MRDRQLYRQFEKKLTAYGLSDRQINGRHKQDVIVPASDATFQQFAFDPTFFFNTDRQLYEKHGIRWQSFQKIPVGKHKRVVPEWTANDAKCREFLAHRWPGAFKNSKEVQPSRRKWIRRARKRIAPYAFVLYHWFRRLDSAESIAELMGVTADVVIRIAGAIRKHGEDFFSTEPKRVCCHRWSQHRGSTRRRA